MHLWRFLLTVPSGGNHQYNYNAFAYHIALAVGDPTGQRFAYFNEHCTMRRTTTGKTSTWEVAVNVFDGNKYEDGVENIKCWNPEKK